MKLFPKILIILFSSLFLFPFPVLAAFSVADVGGSIGLGSADLESAVVSLIQFVLGFLGLVAVIFIIIGGFRWMTAGGNEEKISSAKKLITNAVIGLVIIILSWAIVLFALNVLTNVTNPRR